MGVAVFGSSRGRGAFSKPAKVCCEACWRYEKCEC
jgi:hypothetical protein